MNRKGITLIELLVALSVSGILVAGLYKTFISQQHTYTVQDQVVDMQQNVRLAINRMTRELRMAGFGRMGASDSNFFGAGPINGSNMVLNPGGGGTSLTVVEAYGQAVTTLAPNADGNPPALGQTYILVNDVSGFNTGSKKYICINGTDSVQIKSINGKQIDLDNKTPLSSTEQHQPGEPVYLIQAITYSIGPSEGKSCLLRDDHLGAGPQPVAENVENIEFRNPDGSIPLNPSSACMQVAITVTTDKTDPDYKLDGGYRKRTLTSNIQVRNLFFK